MRHKQRLLQSPNTAEAAPTPLANANAAPQVSQLHGELAGGVLGPDQMADHARTLEQLTTLRESNAHLRAHNRELAEAAARREREAAEARAQLQPLHDKITSLEVALQVEREAVAKAVESAQRAELSMQRLSQRYGAIDLDEYNRVKAEAAQIKVGALWGLSPGRKAWFCRSAPGVLQQRATMQAPAAVLGTHHVAPQSCLKGEPRTLPPCSAAGGSRCRQQGARRRS
jgi:hypothetical protein